jgi:3-isopropylmalate/(R)-2-methylmalate dehydratase small subunit
MAVSASHRLHTIPMNWIFGDNINTDLITPGRYNITTDPKELAKACFIEYRPEFREQVKAGDFVVAGENFGCGSSRETAPVSLKYSNVRAVIAKSYARIFFRNAINLGLLCVIANTDGIDETDELELDVESQVLKNRTKGEETKVQIPSMMLRLYQEGGIIPYLKKHGLAALKDLERF